MKRKICVITGTRAEYGLLYPLLKTLEKDPEFELQLIVTGMHLSNEFGLTVAEIDKEFVINKKIEMLLSSDTKSAMNKSMGLAQISLTDAYSDLQPDLVIGLGDRFELFSAITAAFILGIPIAHIHGGELTEGAIDDSLRHCITKLSHLHFTSTEEYRRRVIQLGEQPSNVFDVGAIGIDNIRKMKLLSRSDFEKSIDFVLGKKNYLITFHPVTNELEQTGYQFNQLLLALKQQIDSKFIFTYANCDANGRLINSMIDTFVNKNRDISVCFNSLGQKRYLSALQFMDAMIGNSSSGIIEAPYFKIGVINIGDRQKGRIKSDCIIDCEYDEKSINQSFKKLASESYKHKLDNNINPYGDGYTSEKIVSLLKNMEYKNLFRKSFYDLK